MTAPYLSPSQFEKARSRLYDQLVVLHDAWAQYLYLFGSDSTRVQMLNACAAWFFAACQRLLINESLLGVSRLTDAPGSDRGTNLTIDTLLRDPSLERHPELRADLRRRIASARKAAGPIRVHRNKYIAHLDHALATGDGTVSLPKLPRRRISKVIELLEDCFSEHALKIRETSISFAVESLRGPDALVAILEKSDRWKRFQEIQAQIASRTTNASDVL